jgi:NADP-dependent 3-hydroxy acid dehydrogenase YdfG
MNTSETKCIALITGASSGIGAVERQAFERSPGASVQRTPTRAPECLTSTSRIHTKYCY